MNNDELLASIGAVSIDTDVSYATIDEASLVANGKTFRDTIGRTRFDPITDQQLAYIHVLGKELYMDSDEIKHMFEIDSLSALNIGQGIDLINALLGKDQKEVQSGQITKAIEREKLLVWTRTKESHMNKVGNKVARCGHCVHFTGRCTLETGKCLKGFKPNSFSGELRAPLVENCFEYKHGPLTEKTKKEKENGNDTDTSRDYGRLGENQTETE